MAYGQTGSGKTHTIFGSKPQGVVSGHTGSHPLDPGDSESKFQNGLVPRSVNHIFDYIKKNPNKGQFRVTISFLEIYMEQITDLFDTSQR